MPQFDSIENQYTNQFANTVFTFYDNGHVHHAVYILPALQSYVVKSLQVHRFRVKYTYVLACNGHCPDLALLLRKTINTTVVKMFPSFTRQRRHAITSSGAGAHLAPASHQYVLGSIRTNLKMVLWIKLQSNNKLM